MGIGRKVTTIACSDGTDLDTFEVLHTTDLGEALEFQVFGKGLRDIPPVV